MTAILNIDEIQKILEQFDTARDWKKFHNPKNLSMALAGEAGELLEIFQWLTDYESTEAQKSNILQEKVSHELADILLYAIRIAGLMNINLPEAIIKKIAINNKKYPADVVKGQAKKYNEYASNPD